MMNLQLNNGILILYILAFIILTCTSLIAQEDPPQIEDDNCLACHVEIELLPDDYRAYDIHLQTGLSCSGCHGGDPSKDDIDQAKSRRTRFIGIPAKKDIAKVCGRCHSNIEFMRAYQPRIPTDQVVQYFTSIHGQKLQKGDPKVANCSSCHTAHGIITATDSRSTVHPLNVPATCNRCHGDPVFMAEYKIPTNQYEDFSASVHGLALLENQDTGAPACNDCHGNHGAMPPGITSISHVCGICHNNNLKYFTASKMGTFFEEQELHACEECHDNHKVLKTSDEMIGVGQESVCLGCHNEGDPGYESAKNIYERLKQVVELSDSADVKRMEVQNVGMDDVEIGYLLRDAHQNLIQARTLVHTFDPEQVGAQTNEAIKKAQAALALAAQELKDYSVRRRGFGIATLFITLLLIALFMKIRDIEKKAR